MDPRPIPIWRRWMKDPKKAEKLYIFYYVSVIAANLLIVVGFIIFIVWLLRR